MTDETMITAAEARALREAATPGPWQVGKHAESMGTRGCPSYCCNVYGPDGQDVTRACAWMGGADAALAAAAPALAQALEAAERSECILAATLADVERARQAERQRADELEAERDEAREEVARLRGEMAVAVQVAGRGLHWSDCYGAHFPTSGAVEETADGAAMLASLAKEAEAHNAAMREQGRREGLLGAANRLNANPPQPHTSDETPAFYAGFDCGVEAAVDVLHSLVADTDERDDPDDLAAGSQEPRE